MIEIPDVCKPCGSYGCSVPMPLNGKVQDIDICIAHIVAALNAGGVNTVACCCGHGVRPARITLSDGRDIYIEQVKLMKGPK